MGEAYEIRTLRDVQLGIEQKTNFCERAGIIDCSLTKFCGCKLSALKRTENCCSVLDASEEVPNVSYDTRMILMIPIEIALGE